MIRPILFMTAMALAMTLGAAALKGSPRCGLCIVGLNGQASAKTTNSGVFTAEQAERGKKVFEAKCTACHDTARFTGEMFIDLWAGKPLKDVWDIASGTMPEDNPGSLPQQEYADILAYFLHLNAFPTGETELKPDPAAMAAITIEKRP